MHSFAPGAAAWTARRTFWSAARFSADSPARYSSIVCDFVATNSPSRPSCRRPEAFGAEHRQLPDAGSLIVAHQVRIAVGNFQFEVPVLGCQPRVEHLRDGDATVTKNQRAWRLLAAMAGIALHANTQEPLLTHRINM